MRLITFCSIFAALLFGSELFGNPFCRINPIPENSQPIPWEKAVEITGFAKAISLNPASEQTSLKLLHDGKNLYGKLICQQRDKTSGSRIRDDQLLWKNNSVEMFFANAAGDVRHVLINSEGTVTDMLHRKAEDGKTVMDISWSPVHMLSFAKEKDFWQAEFRIPLAELDFDAGGNNRFNVARNNFCRKEFSSWCPLEKHAWFQPDQFGTVSLAPDSVKTCGVQWDKMPNLKPNDKIRFTLAAAVPLTVSVKLDFEGKGKVVRNFKMKPEQKKLVAEFDSRIGGNKCEMTLNAAGKTIYRHIARPKGSFIEVYALPGYYISGVKDMPTEIFWQQFHTLPGGELKRGLRVRTDYEILFDLPEGITVAGGKTVGPSSRGKNRIVVAVPEKFAFSASNWLKSRLYADLPSGTKGRIWYQVRKGDYLQPERYFDFTVESFTPVVPPKRIPVYFYNYFPRNVEQAEQVRKYGINTILYRGFDVKWIKTFLQKGFYVIRGGYFWPGGDNNGYINWPKWDRAARAQDINGNTVYGKGGPQISPSYRGKYFMEGVKKEREFARATGIRHFSFDMENYIMPNGRIACFRPETLARFEKWFKEKYPGEKLISPKVFEKEPEKYPKYHSAWIAFKDYIFADFFNEFKRQMGDIPDPGRSVPWDGVTISEWSFPNVASREAIYNTMRGLEFLKAFSWFERSAYSSADVNIRTLLHLRETLRKHAPGIPVNLIICPSPERLDLYAKPGDSGFYTSPAPKLEDELKYKIFDAMAYGCRGIAVWYYPRMTARAWRNLTEALRAVNKIEHIVLSGSPIDGLSCPQPLGIHPKFSCYQGKIVLKNQPKILVHGIRSGKESLIAVSEYCDLKTVEVPVSIPGTRPAVVSDVEDGKEIGTLSPGNRTVKVRLDQRRCRLLHIKEQ